MANDYFQFYDEGNPEAALHADLTDECYEMFGIPVLYMPRQWVDLNVVLGEDGYSKFTEDRSFPLTMYMESFEGYGGRGDMSTPHGLVFEDKCTLNVTKPRFLNEVQNFTGFTNDPKEGDLIKIKYSGEIFELKFRDYDKVFFDLGSAYIWQLHFEKFYMGGETFAVNDTDIDQLDQFLQTDSDEEQIIEDRNANTDPRNDDQTEIQDLTEPSEWGDY